MVMERCERGKKRQDPSESQGTEWTSMVDCVQSHAVKRAVRRKKLKAEDRGRRNNQYKVSQYDQPYTREERQGPNEPVWPIETKPRKKKVR